MLYGVNLQKILVDLNLSVKDAATMIGINEDTLSNVLNGRFDPSKKTKYKIENFVISKGFSQNVLFKNNLILSNFRVRALVNLSGNEKSSVKKSLIGLNEKLYLLNEWEICDNLELEKAFEIHALPYKSNSIIYPSERFELFLNKIKNNFRNKKITGKSFYEVIRNLLKTDSELFGSYTSRMQFDFSADINLLLENFGIRLFYISLRTSKIEATSIMQNPNFSHSGDIDFCPGIFINTDVCKSFEKISFIIAKEFYKMVKGYVTESEYDFSDGIINIDYDESEAQKFAQEFLISDEKLVLFIEKYRLFQFDSISESIDFIKMNFKVGYKLVIKKLMQNNVLNKKTLDEYVQDYITELSLRCSEFNEDVVFIGDEPNPLSLSYLTPDFFEVSVLAALKKEIITDDIASKLLNLSETEINKKIKYANYMVESIVQ